MQQQTDNGYQILTPVIDCYTKEETVSNLTKKCYNLNDSAVPDDLFLKLIFGTADYGYRVTVKLPDGNPVQRAVISGITALPNLDLKTDENGKVIGKSSSDSVTLTCTSPFSDMQLAESVNVTSTGLITDVELVLSFIPIIKLTSSGSFDLTKLSPLATRFDVTIVGRGRSGGGGHWYDSDEIGSSYSAFVATGGSGGYVTTKTDVVLKDRNGVFTYTIGSGGQGSTNYSYNPDSQSSLKSGYDGRSTTFIYDDVTLTANRGIGGSTWWYRLERPMSYAGPARNGQGGSTNRGSGGNGTGYIFNDSSLGLAGGGGGGGGMNTWSSSGSQQYSDGGKPYGGGGSYIRIAPTSGSYGGGGGGVGRGAGGRYTPTSGAGGTGIVYIRFKT